MIDSRRLSIGSILSRTQQLPAGGPPHGLVVFVVQLLVLDHGQVMPVQTTPHFAPAAADEVPRPGVICTQPLHCWEIGISKTIHNVPQNVVVPLQEPRAGTDKPATSSALAAQKHALAIERDSVSFIEELLCILLTTYSGPVPTICAILLLFNIL
jgi:hypothetical protein